MTRALQICLLLNSFRLQVFLCCAHHPDHSGTPQWPGAAAHPAFDYWATCRGKKMPLPDYMAPVGGHKEGHPVVKSYHYIGNKWLNLFYTNPKPRT